MRSSRLVAESLRLVPEPVATVIPRLAPVGGEHFRGFVAELQRPARSDAPPPAFLRPHQVDPWRRAMAALEGWQGAIVAEPVGTGKTWIALAVAARIATSTTVIGPAALADQWRHAAARAAVAIRWHSLERLSRGHLPPRARLVIVDEAHRLRHHGTRRVATLSPWLLGRRVLFLTATPIVNRRDDLLALLSLLVPDDALVLDGIRSLRVLSGQRVPPAALRRLVIRSAGRAEAIPVRTRRLRITGAERRRADRLLASLAALRLGEDPGVRQLLHTVLLDAGASSDAAWRAALHRYRLLLLQSRDAGGASREALRRCAGRALDQLLLWPMLGEIAGGIPVPLDDLAGVERALAGPDDDAGWITPLRRLVDDGLVTVCFCRHRATARALARELGDGTAWITGSAAGIGPHRVARAALLAAFGPDRARWQLRRSVPTVLVATEVLAEGLDLQGASRVVHVDLPWHGTRLDQRTGRVRRIGQAAPAVEVVTRTVPRAIERALGMRRRIRRKGGAAERWMAALTEAPGADGSSDNVAIVASAPLEGRRAVTWIELAAGSRSGCLAIAMPGADSAASPGEVPLPRGITAAAPADAARAADLAATAVRQALSIAVAAAVGRTALVSRILGLARRAAAMRQGADLVRLDRLLALATASGPHGLDLLLDRLRAGDDAALLQAALPAMPARQPAAPRRLAVLLAPGPWPPLP